MTRQAIHLVLSIALLIPSVAICAEEATTRTWTDSTGSFTVDATLVEYQDGKVTLKRDDGKELTVPFDRLSAEDQAFLTEGASESKAEPRTAQPGELSGDPQELKNDDGTPAGKKSFPRGIAASFKTTESGQYLRSIKIHGARYGQPQAPTEDFHVSLCDKDFNLIADFTFPYAKFARGNQKWVTLPVKPTEVPEEFVICLNFNPTSTKGVFVSHDADGKSLVGLPGKRAGNFTGGDWLLRVTVDKRK